MKVQSGLTVVYEGKRILIGIASFGPIEGCATQIPNVFTRITSEV
jgi:hypothetical protein